MLLFTNIALTENAKFKAQVSMLEGALQDLEELHDSHGGRPDHVGPSYCIYWIMKQLFRIWTSFDQSCTKL